MGDALSEFTAYEVEVTSTFSTDLDEKLVVTDNLTD